MKAIQMTDNIFWVGGIDWDLRNFHGYLTQRGSTYNAYLIIDEKITLVDTTKYYLVDEMLQRISKVIDPSKIDYVISNHVEMDHSGGLPAVLKAAPNAQVLCSPKGEQGLKAHYGGEDWNFKIVESGDVLSLGKHSLQFLLTPMVHWPDNMVAYMPEEKILFSNDSFGQHIASSERFDDEFPLEIIVQEAQKYYANIVLPYAAQVQKELEAASKLDIGMIAPSHGLIWKNHIPLIVEKYTQWASNNTDKKAVIVYDTMWGSTKKMAQKIQEAFDEKGYRTVFCSLGNWHISDIMTEVIDAEYVCVGSPTLNKNMLPTVSSFLTYLKGLAPKNRKTIAFGSYGWGQMSVKQIQAELESCGMQITDSFDLKYIPSQEQLQDIYNRVSEKL